MALVGTTIQRMLEFNERQIDRQMAKGDGPLDTRSFAWTAQIEAHWEEIATEVRALIDMDVKLPQVSELAGFDQGNEGSWSNLAIYSYGTWIDVNRWRCPRTTELVRDIPGLQIAGFSVLGPHSHLPRHRGPNRGALRYQVGLIVPPPKGSSRIQIGRVTHTWSEGASMVFDHSVEHEAWNDSDSDRYVLFIEFIWPLPGLTGALNRLTQKIFAFAARGLPKRAIDFDKQLNDTQ